MLAIRLRAPLALVLALPLLARAEVFINELHYDNDGTDTGEFVEVVATAGENLALYRLAFYNGNGGALVTSTSPNVQPLGNVASVTCGQTISIGYLAPNQIENGPDGIALVAPDDSVVQFLSYEGAFTANGSFANGLGSAQIPVSEAGTAPVGTSLQLGGTGTGYAGFTWQASATATRGSCNNGQAFQSPVDNPPTLLSTVPANGAPAVAVDTAITLTFSESVSVSGDWFALTCTGSATPRAVTVSGTGGARLLTPDLPLPFDTDCALAVDETLVVDIDGTPHALSNSADLAFHTQVDDAPIVLSTTPADGATGVPVNQVIAIQFSEDVAVPAAPEEWIAFECEGTPLAGTVSADEATYEFTPLALLTPGDACSVTLDAAAIVDLDGTPHALVGDNVFAFQVAPDEAPTLVSTFPSDGAVNVATGSLLTVTFSEPVTAGAGAFLLECPIGTSIALAADSTDQIAWTLDPNVTLPNDTTCRLRVIASQVVDIDGTPDALAQDAGIDFTTNAGAAGYYARVDASSCRTLRATLHGVIDDHQVYPYSAGSTDTFDIVEAAEQDPDDPSKVLDIYQNKKFIKGNDRSGTNPSCLTSFNREHTWPKSLGFPDESVGGLPNAPHTDTHMLMASMCQFNSTRGNDPYRTCSQPGCSVNETVANYGVGGVSGQHNLYKNAGYEVWNKRKGDVARGVLYMDIRYEGGTHSKTGQVEPDLVLVYDAADATPGNDDGTPGHLETLLAWHQLDPPSNPAPGAGRLDNLEPVRNDLIESYQHNRNPLIDHPEWASILFASPCSGPAVVAVDDDFAMMQGGVLNAAAPGVLRDDRNGTSKNGQGLSASILVPPANGSATVTNAATGAFTYTPSAGFCGTDSFTYAASDGVNSDQGVAWIEVACSGGGTAPTAVADAVAATEDAGQHIFNVLANDTDPDGGLKRVEAVTQPAGGSVAIGPNGADVRFTPALNACADTSFQYTLNGGSSATVSVTMTCLNDAPVANDANFALAENSANGTLVGTVTASDVDAGATLSYAITGGNTGSAFAITPGGALSVATGAVLDFETTPTFSLSVTVTDNAGATDTATVVVTLSNVEEGSADAKDDAYTVGEDSVSNAFAVLANDTPDPDGGALAVVQVGTPSHGSAGFTAGGLTYTPAANHCGSDSVSYTVGGGDVAQVQITVTCVNDAPAAGDAVFTLAENSAVATVVGTVSASDVDAGQTLAFAITGGNGAGGFAIDAATGAIRVANAAVLDFETTPQFVLSVTVTDDGSPAAQDVATVTIDLDNVDESTGAAHDDSATVTEDSAAASIDVLANDDAGAVGGALQVIAVSAAQHGTTSFTAGAVSYTPDPDYCGADSFTYTIGGGASATVAVTVACVTDAPTLAGALPDRFVVVDRAISPFTVAPAFEGVDAYTLRIDGLPPGVTMDVAGNVSGTPGAEGDFAVTVFAENAGGSVGTGFTLTVGGLPIFADGFED